MPRQIWNEGRVVGYSAYEVYLKHALSVDPDHEPATEKEWLASMMAMGSSMLLRIGADPAGTEYDGLHYVDIQFPADSRLCAANTIIASFFDGEGYIGDNPSNTTTAWATKVTSYGSLIHNDSSSSPTGNKGPNGSIPPVNNTAIENTTAKPGIRQYMKIVDGIVIQPGTWVDNSNKPPQKDFTPTLSEYPRLRIAFRSRITEPFFLLLTGFTNRSVVDGVTGFDTAVNTQSPSDGDFLGPWAFPWANKIIFSVSSEILDIASAKIGINLDAKGHAITCYTKVDEDIITALSMSDTDGDPYSLTGSSGDIDIKLTQDNDNVNFQDDTTYTGYMTWGNLIQMLHENKKAKISFVVKKVDLSNPVILDITNVFLNADNSPVSFTLGLGKNIERVLLNPYDGSSSISNAPNDGYFKVILKLYNSPFGTTSKFTIDIKGYIKHSVTVTDSGESEYFRGTGVDWRGVKPNDVSESKWKPLFGTSEPGKNGNDGSAVIKLWDSVPEGEYSALGKSIMTANTHAESWGLNVSIQYNPVVGAHNNDQIRLIDKSCNYGNGNRVTTYLGVMTSDSTATWEASKNMNDGRISHSYSGMCISV